MISSKNILQAKNLSFVIEFLQKHGFKTTLLEDDGDFSLIIFRPPLFIEILDGLNENCLQITLGDTNSSLIMLDGSVMPISFTLGWHSIEDAHNTSFAGNEEGAVFLSSDAEKMHNLYFFLQALDMLLPKLQSNGIKSIQDGTAFPSLDLSHAAYPMSHELKKNT